MDNTGESRATVLTPVIGFNWQNGGGYGRANPGLGITENGTGPLSTSQVPAVAGVGVRRLTPLECERLQGFPDDWTAGQADSSRYRQMGNAVAVPVVEWIISRLVEVDGA
jgi:DNA (cytosine-5)-methyltransferase 1